MKAKHQRLTLVALAIAAVGGASVLALSSLKDQDSASQGCGLPAVSM